jgi:hypothetical protein
MQWAPPINTLTLFDITGEPVVEGQDPPDCQICYQLLYNPALFPSEITTCHHRFHRDCLRNQWCNNNAGNTLEACRCPNCEQIFNCNTQLQDLTPQVNARLQELQQPAVVEVEAQGLQVAVPQVQQIPENNLQTYTRQNYLIDRATRRFTDCLPRIEGIREHEETKRDEWVERQIKFINSIATNFKFNVLYAEQIRRILPIINRINDNLQNQEFITRLLAQRNLPNGTPDTSTWIETNLLAQYRHNGPPPQPYVKYTSFFTNLLNIGCYTGESRGRYQLPPAERAIFTPLQDVFIVNLLQKMIHTYVLWKTEPDFHFVINSIQKIYETVPTGGPINILPHFGNPIEIGFFQHYFQCFVDFLTALLEVNYNLAFQLQGGKQSNIKTRKRRKFIKRVRKTKRKGKK